MKFKVSREEMLSVLTDVLDAGKSPAVFLLNGEPVEAIKIVHAERTDWCGDCGKEHGFECPAPQLPEEIKMDDTAGWPRVFEVERKFNQLLAYIKHHERN